MTKLSQQVSPVWVPQTLHYGVSALQPFTRLEFVYCTDDDGNKATILHRVIQSNSKLLSGFTWPINFKTYVLINARMLRLFSVLQYWFYE
jgi:hypothetical protein